jgi:hypothetical protein
MQIRHRHTFPPPDFIDINMPIVAVSQKSWLDRYVMGGGIAGGLLYCAVCSLICADSSCGVRGEVGFWGERERVVGF